MKTKWILPAAFMILVLIFAFLFFFPALVIGGVFSPRVTPSIAQRDYQRYEAQFNRIAQYVSENNINDFYIHEDELKDGSIPDEEVYRALEILMKAKYRTIGIEENTLFFQKYATLDCGRGILYVLDGGEPYLQFLTDAKELAAENWYYYEDDFNQWRLENKE